MRTRSGRVVRRIMTECQAMTPSLTSVVTEPEHPRGRVKERKSPP